MKQYQLKNIFFDSLKQRYQNRINENLESMKGSEFVFDYVQLLYYKCHKINQIVLDHV